MLAISIQTFSRVQEYIWRIDSTIVNVLKRLHCGKVTKLHDRLLQLAAVHVVTCHTKEKEY
jgi:hypothetical protein